MWSGKEGRIRVGYMESDGVVRPQPPIVRGIQQLVAALSKNDLFEVVPFGKLFEMRGLLCLLMLLPSYQSLSTTKGEESLQYVTLVVQMS